MAQQQDENINDSAECQFPELQDAVCRGDLEGVKLYLERGDEVNSLSYMQPLLNTAIIVAFIGRNNSDQLLKDCFEIIDLLLKNGADVNASSSWGDTPLHVAVRYGFLDIVKRLIEEGADVNVEHKYSEPPLFWAMHNVDIAKLLLEKGARVDVAVDKYHGVNTLLDLVQRDGTDELKELFASFSETNVRYQEKGDGELPAQLESTLDIVGQAASTADV